MGVFYLICWLRNYPQDRGTRPRSAVQLKPHTIGRKSYILPGFPLHLKSMVLYKFQITKKSKRPSMPSYQDLDKLKTGNFLKLDLRKLLKYWKMSLDNTN